MVVPVVRADMAICLCQTMNTKICVHEETVTFFNRIFSVLGLANVGRSQRTQNFERLSVTFGPEREYYTGHLTGTPHHNRSVCGSMCGTRRDVLCSVQGVTGIYTCICRVLVYIPV